MSNDEPLEFDRDRIARLREELNWFRDSLFNDHYHPDYPIGAFNAGDLYGSLGQSVSWMGVMLDYWDAAQAKKEAASE